MKKIITICASLFIFAAASAQSQLKTEYYDAAKTKKKSEGSIMDPNFKLESLTMNDYSNRDGKWTEWFEDGKVMTEMQFTKGVMSGHWKSYFQNGKLNYDINYDTHTAMFYFIDGEKLCGGNMYPGFKYDGQWTGWYKSGKVNYVGNYKMGKRHGQWTWYDEKTGAVQLQEKYDNQTLVK